VRQSLTGAHLSPSVTAYAISKFCIYLFLLERVYIVFSANAPGENSRWSSTTYKTSAVFIVLWAVVFSLMCAGRIARFREQDGACEIGLKLFATVPMLVVDFLGELPFAGGTNEWLEQDIGEQSVDLDLPQSTSTSPLPSSSPSPNLAFANLERSPFALASLLSLHSLPPPSTSYSSPFYMGSNCHGSASPPAVLMVSSVIAESQG
jgi:hypothetical protein